MNLAEYLSELLGLHDEVNVPGLGFFVRNRVNAYYNEGEARFYPPYHTVSFVAQPKEDDIFAQYVAGKKNISLASSKYFVEKFTTKLREDASKGKYLFADLGLFQSDFDQLIFKPNERIPNDPDFYGYPPIDIFKAGQPLPADTRTQVLAPDQPVSSMATATTTLPPPRAVHSPEYYEDEVEPKRRANVWLIILVSLAIIALAAFGVYKFYPQAFDKVKEEYYKITGKEESPAVIRKETKPVKKDTTTKITTPVDTTSKTVTPIPVKPDSVKLPYFEAVIAKVKAEKSANGWVSRLKTLGINAYIMPDLPGTGKLYKVSVGQYPTYDAADSVLKSLLKQKIISKHEVPLEIKPQ